MASTTAQPQQLTLRAGRDLRAALGLPRAAGKAAGGYGLAAGGLARRAARSATSPARFPAAASREISKSIANVLLKGPVFVQDYHHDMDEVAEILKRDFSAIYKTGRRTRARAGPS